MKIKDIPWFNRPGFKLTRKGVNSLDDAELLSIIFGVGSKGESALELSNKLLRKYNLNRLEDLSVKDLAKECNGNFNKALQILSLIEICKRYNKLVKGGFNDQKGNKSIASAKDIYNISRSMPLKLHCLVFSESQFDEMINTKESNVGQEALKNNIILYGIEQYYERI